MLIVCGCKDDGSHPVAGGSGGVIESAQAFKPGALNSSKGILRMGQTPIDVEIVREQKGPEITFFINMDGETMETEKYLLEDEAFYLVEAAGETFEPPLPLIKFPLEVGKSWKWQGLTRSGDYEHPAMAMIVTSAQNTQLIVTVALELKSGGPNPAMRTLTFWFEDGRGIYKRELGASSTRTSSEE